MACQRCKCDRILKVDAKCSDMCSVQYKGEDKNGYVPSGLGIGGGDYIELSICMGCGQVQGDSFPIHEQEILVALMGD